MTNLPSGTVTFLFTDIEGSTKLAQEYSDKWESSRERHHAILRSAIEAHAGYVFQIIGDAFCVAFHTADDALRTTVKSQTDLHNEAWDETPINVRMGIHTGKAEVQENGEYHGYLTLSLVQRVMSAGHGGQILLSDATEKLLLDQLPKDVSLRDMGQHKFKDVPHPVRVFQVTASDLQSEFPALRTLSAFPNNLPSQLTSFVGREKELADVKKLLHDAHMLTLIGPGGTGKTRLSIQAAQESLAEYPVPCKNLIQSDLLQKTGTRVLFTVIGKIGSSRTMEHIIRWVGSFSNTFSQPFYRSSTPHDYPMKKKIWKS